LAYKPNPDGKSNRTGIKSGPNAQKTGPKPIPIDWNQVGTLAGLHATQSEIAGYIGISVSQLTVRYELEHEGETLGEFIASKRDAGKAKLRVAQLKSAIENENVQMQIFLGKNWLGQSDKMEHGAIAPMPLTLNYKDPNHDDRGTGLLEVGGTADDDSGSADVPGFADADLVEGDDELV
jgi:hypothetical protein